jgi:hypothetical protein
MRPFEANPNFSDTNEKTRLPDAVSGVNRGRRTGGGCRELARVGGGDVQLDLLVALVPMELAHAHLVVAHHAGVGDLAFALARIPM